ncbi:Maf family protein [Gordonia sp. VNK1]|uniref:Maf family protein n=1 Tax=Gordonia oleivorans TaxID=3156618 RepID=UPI0032B3747D
MSEPAGSTERATDTPRYQVVLGSASPARLSVLRQAGVDPRVLVSDVDEDAVLDSLVGAPPDDVVARLAMAKADAVVATLVTERTADDAAREDLVVLTCDSMLLFRGRLTGKPHTPEAAIAHWHKVRGHSAQLLTGHHLAVLRGLEVTASATATRSTTVSFAPVTDAEIEAYVATGEPLEVAGGFTLDGLGGWFVDSVDGDPSSVLGIGLPTVRDLLRRVGLSVTDLWAAPA